MGGEERLIDIIEYPTADAELYMQLLPRETADQLAELAAQLRDTSVIHINSTAYGDACRLAKKSHTDPRLALLGLSQADDDAKQAGERIAQLLADEELCATIGRNAKDRVRQRFLIPRLLNDYLCAAQRARSLAPLPG